MDIYGTRPKLNFIINIIHNVCTRYPTIILCADLLDVASGKHERSVLQVKFKFDINTTTKIFFQRKYSLLFSQNPSGFSTQSLIHLIQFFGDRNRFEYYDFGPEINYKVYNSTTPPEYPVWKIQVPVHLFYGEFDSFMSDEVSS